MRKDGIKDKGKMKNIVIMRQSMAESNIFAIERYTKNFDMPF